MLMTRFSYCFVRPPDSEYPPILTMHGIAPGAPVIVTGKGGAITALPFAQVHGDIPSLGFRFGDVAYSSDLSDMPAASAAALAGLDLWIVDALRYHHHPSHFSVDDALAWIDRIRPQRAILTNMHTDLDYAVLRARLPAGVEPAFDGMRIEL
jgi:phosphoribosyl 1,2-cyclic phosphate phosphodiesterase